MPPPTLARSDAVCAQSDTSVCSQWIGPAISAGQLETVSSAFETAALSAVVVAAVSAVMVSAPPALHSHPAPAPASATSHAPKPQRASVRLSFVVILAKYLCGPAPATVYFEWCSHFRRSAGASRSMA